MTFEQSIFLIFSVLGGVALFLLGMGIMTEGLRLAAGERIRGILFRATRNRGAGVGFGTVLGFLVHSSAASVMVVGFVNSGLMTLRNSVPLLMGASIGTTLSMQLISFRLTDYAFFAIALGFLGQIAGPRETVKQLGRALLGFGLLFLGLDFLSNTIEPYRNELAPWLERIDGATWLGLFLGIAVALAVTAIIQSSGATIGMLFALIAAGVFTDLRQVFPIILGAHIGTAATGLLASVGANLDARRAALANLLFQLFNVGLALLIAPILLWLAAATGGDLVRQAANLHTYVMVAAVVVLLPFLHPFLKGLLWMTPSRTPTAQPSHLDPELLRRPDEALAAALREIGRSVGVCQENFRLSRGFLEERNRKLENVVRLNEAIVNEIRVGVKAYLAGLSKRRLQPRHALMAQYLNRCMSDIERVGDHIAKLVDIRKRQRKSPEDDFDCTTMEELGRLFDQAETVLQALAESLSPDHEDFEAPGRHLLEVRDRYDELSQQVQAEANTRVAEQRLHPLTGLFFSEYVSALDRIVKHCKMVAREQQQPFFRTGRS